MTRIWIPLAALAITAAGCNDDKAQAEKPAATIAPTSTALTAAKPATASAQKLTVDKATSKVDFLMEAPQEKIHGLVHGATTGELSIDFTDVSKSTGLVTIDLGELVLKQAKVEKDGKIGEETKVDKQNEHARTWLEISPDTPADMRKQNGVVQFAIKSIEVTGPKDVSKMTGPERKVLLKATGDLLLHGHKSEKTADLEATFKYDGDKPVSVLVKTVKPIAVGLAEHDVKPRDAFGKLALKTLDALAPKVAKEAPITLEFTARAGN
ncbi:Hypothetical protein A7982_05709 [Minicystis rosea]|nr:Hypothetical protein A7982_05709 [Minicystis rosea]